MTKKIKPETEIKNLKADIEKLRTICSMAGVPPLVVYLPDFVLNTKEHEKLTPAGKRWVKKWAKEKIAEYENGLKDKKVVVPAKIKVKSK